MLSHAPEPTRCLVMLHVSAIRVPAHQCRRASLHGGNRDCADGFGMAMDRPDASPEGAACILSFQQSIPRDTASELSDDMDIHDSIVSVDRLRTLKRQQGRGSTA